MSARIDSLGRVVQLGGRAEPTEVITADDVADGQELADLLTAMRAAVAAQERRHVGEFVDFEDLTIPASGTVTLDHGFNARVRWWVVDWEPTFSGNTPILEKLTTGTTANSLVLNSNAGGKATIRVEKAG